MPAMTTQSTRADRESDREFATLSMSKLRCELSATEPLSVLDGLSQVVNRLFTERTGMTEELLCVYEQLGTVFELTRKLAGVNSEEQAVRAFLDSLSLTFRGCDVGFARPDPLRKWILQGGSFCPGEWMDAGIRRARNQGSVIVEVFPAVSSSNPIAEVMFATMTAGDVFLGAIVLARRPPSREFRASDMCLLQSLTTFCGDWIRNLRLTQELRRATIGMVRLLVSAVDQKDEYTSGHSLRVGYYSLTLGRALKLGRDDLQMLQWSALMHDVGKIGIRDEVLKKPGKLTKEEFDHIKEHPVRSYKIVKDVPQMAGALDGVLHHHERWDGTGYPDGLAGEAIPFQARIIQIADVFDALTSNRSYRPSHTWESALQIMKEEAGKTLDPNLQPVWDRLMRDRLESTPEAWAQLVDWAGRFGPDSEESIDCQGEE